MSNITLDDTSPLIRYTSRLSTSGWTQDARGDTSYDKYFGKSYHSTGQSGDLMELIFNGTGVAVYGAKRSNHGVYTTKLDDQQESYVYGNSDGKNETFQALLFSAGGLDPTRSHTVQLVNSPQNGQNPSFNRYFDIDYIVVTSAATGTVYTTTLDDRSPAITFTAGWTNGDNAGGYYNNTNRLTTLPGSALSLPFTGSAIQLIAGTNYDHGTYSVVLDGGASQVYNGSSPALFYNATLFLAINLTDGPHQLTLTNLGGGVDNTAALDFDVAIVNSSINPMTSGTNTTTPIGGGPGNYTGSAVPGKAQNVGSIAGGVVGGVVGLLIIAAMLWFFCFRKRHRYKQARREAVDLNGDANQPEHDGAEVKPYPTNTMSSYAAASDDQYRAESGPMLSMIPPPPPSNATSYPRTVPPTSTSGASHYDYEDFQVPSPVIGTGSTPASRSGETSPSGQAFVGRGTPPARIATSAYPTHPSDLASPIVTTVPAKTPGVNLPYTARSTTSPIRMSVAGREQDMGPIRIPLSDSGHGHDNGPLPPDYQQATEPLPGQSPTRP